ncbi:MAG: hypothetical protein JWP12_419 [Bacteroidetes bacterium]|nr:hypothetical protein [Bacteroidota bacterium]
MRPIVKTITWLTVFAIAMGFLETSVVVYLRKLYYPGGFDFPLIPVTCDIATTEFWREVATIIMLIGAGIMSGKNPLQRFVFFLYTFAIWDVFYYVFLKVVLDWPQSLFTWDILFLIPVPWVGPVLAPCLISLSMILFMLVVVVQQEKGKNVKINFVEWLLFITGSVTAIVSFMWDYIMYVSSYGADKGVWTLSSNQNMFDEVKHYVPAHFNWGLFCVGQGVILLAIVLVWWRGRRMKIKE